MKRFKLIFTITVLLFIILVNGISFADSEKRGRRYEVTITNISRSQIFSPPVVISHDENFRLFTLGSPASPQLYPLAEDGLTGPLSDHLGTLPSVFDYVMAGGPLLPGASVTFEISTRGRFRFVTAAGMLVTTNDAFFAVQKLRILPNRAVQITAEAYDAGSEANSEDCSYIPGPPCSGGGVRDTGNAEGYVHIHAGIHGTADLIPARDDWRNPVAEMTVRPIYR
jgi:hypothetical protein